MTGITNKPEPEERANQALVDEREAQLLPDEQRGPNDHHPVGKDRQPLPADPDVEAHAPGRVVETGIGRGLEHKGH